MTRLRYGRELATWLATQEHDLRSSILDEIDDVVHDILDVRFVDDHMKVAAATVIAFAGMDDKKRAIGAAVSAFTRLVAAAQKRVRRTLADRGYKSDALEERQAADLERGSVELAKRLRSVLTVGLIRELMSKGEVSKTLIPPGVVSPALAIAGGADVEMETSAGGIYIGKAFVDAMKEMGNTPVAYVWHWNGSARPFSGHKNLNGIEFSSYEDEVLTVHPEDAWLMTPFYRPSDHAGCSCLTSPVFEKDEK